MINIYIGMANFHSKWITTDTLLWTRIHNLFRILWFFPLLFQDFTQNNALYGVIKSLHQVIIATSWLWQIFRHTYFLWHWEILEILAMYLLTGFFGYFSHIRMKLWDFEKMTIDVKCHFNHIISRLYIINKIIN